MLTKKKIVLTTATGITILVVAILCLNIISSRVFTRIDVTEDKIYSLSDGTYKILHGIDEEINIKFYFSRSLKTLPVMIKTYATRVEEVLNEFTSHSKGKIKLEVFDPRPDTDEEEWAAKYGMNGMRLPDGDEMFFGAVFLQGNREFPISYFDPRREEFLEFDLAEALVQIQTKQKAKIGIASSLPVMGGSFTPAPMAEQEPTWTIIEQLKKNYQVESVATTAKEIKDVDILFLIHPKNLDDAFLYAVDQFVMRGGRLFVALDPMSRIDLQTSGGMMARMSGKMPEVGSDLKKLLTAWGVEYDPATLVGDLSRMIQINAGGVSVAYPYFVNLRDEGISKKSIVTEKLKHVMYTEGGFLKKAANSTYDFEPLLQTTKESGTAHAAMATMMPPADFAKELKRESNVYVLAAFVGGNFKSAFPDGPPSAGGEASKEPHLQEATKKTNLFIIADSDFMHDSNSVEKFRFGPQIVVRPMNDNLALVQNVIEYLAGSENLISIRSRGKIARPFTKVEELQKTAQVKWQTEEQRLSSRLQELQKKLSELQAERTADNKMVLSSQQQTEISRFRAEEADVRKARREVRKNLREDIERLGNVLVAMNLVIIPLSVSGFGVAVFVRRLKRMRKGKSI